MPKQQGSVSKCTRTSNHLKELPPPELSLVPEERPIDESVTQIDSSVQASRPIVVKTATAVTVNSPPLLQTETKNCATVSFPSARLKTTFQGPPTPQTTRLFRRKRPRRTHHPIGLRQPRLVPIHELYAKLNILTPTVSPDPFTIEAHQTNVWGSVPRACSPK
jgi:hypothetical protein